MKRQAWGATALAVAAFLLAGAARAQDTAAVSRQVTMHLDAPSPTVAVSRQVTVHLDAPPPTVAVSRQLTMHFAAFPATYATSRQVTMYGNFALVHAVSALRIAAGFQAATGTEAAVFDLPGGAPGVDVGDAARIARYAAGTVAPP